MTRMGGSQFLREDSGHLTSLGVIHRTLPRSILRASSREGNGLYVRDSVSRIIDFA
jgi:hypothetical protein